MNDILPPESAEWQRLERTIQRQAELHGFSEVRPPLLEPTALFVRSIGEVTDVVQKEMYTLERGDESLTLRPEGTAGCARAYIQHSVQAKEPVTRWYYLGPMFRAERPQRGRYRQFYQAGCEIYGDPGPTCDSELIALLAALFSELGIGPLQILVNSIGGDDSRATYRQRLVEFLTPRRSELSELSQQRLETNPLRILDSKNPQDQALLVEAPSTLDALVPADRAHFDELCAQLQALGTPFRVEPRLVRGLDYYTRTVFEVQSEAGNLGSQNTLAAGGRYDGLIAELGGPKVPAIGFAIGLERALLAMANEQRASVPPFCYIAPLGIQARCEALKIATELRSRSVRVELDGRDNSLKSKLRRADSMGARLCLVFGDRELGDGIIQLKDLMQGTQTSHARSEIVSKVAAMLSTGDESNPAAPTAERLAAEKQP